MLPLIFPVRFNIPQGEIVDMYLADKKTIMVVISGAMHVSIVAAVLVGTELYIAGGWLVTGFIIAVFDILPLMLLPVVGHIQNKTAKGQDVKNSQLPDAKSINVAAGDGLKDSPSKFQQIVFFLPDVAVFLNNVAYILLMFAIPVRIKEFTGQSLRTAVLFSTLMVAISFVSSMVLGFTADKKFGPSLVMLIGNVVFYAGAIMAFGSTTEFLAFPGSFEIGSVLVGIGNAAVINIAVMSKFSLYEKWHVKTDGLAERSTAVFNFSLCLSQAVGTVIGGLSVTRASEIPTISGAAAACLVNVIGFLLCIFVR